MVGSTTDVKTRPPTVKMGRPKKLGGSSTKVNAWNIKGVPPEARVLAKKTAHAQDMTLGQYITTLVYEYGIEDIKEVRAQERNLPVGQNQVNDKIQQQMDRLVEIAGSQNALSQKQTAQFNYLLAMQNRSWWQKLTGMKYVTPK